MEQDRTSNSRKQSLCVKRSFKALLLVSFSLSTAAVFAQFKSTGSYVGVMHSSGNLSTVERYNQVFMSTVVPGEVYANTTASFSGLSFVGQFSNVGEEKHNFSLYFNWILGGGTQSYHIDQIRSSYDQPQEDFEIYAALKGGAQYTHIPNSKKGFFGVRTFYWWNLQDGLRSMYDRSTTDDGLAFGLFGAFKAFTLDFSYAPFIGKERRLSYGQIECLYRSGITLGDDNTALVFGTRYEFTDVHEAEKNSTSYTTVANGNAGLLSFLIAVGF
jgi:hypothetical protein